eukprot:972235-Heterocapsa_arctica.AAC.1
MGKRPDQIWFDTRPAGLCPARRAAIADQDHGNHWQGPRAGGSQEAGRSSRRMDQPQHQVQREDQH